MAQRSSRRLGLAEPINLTKAEKARDKMQAERSKNVSKLGKSED